jgi:hypothetical protein
MQRYGGGYTSMTVDGRVSVGIPLQKDVKKIWRTDRKKELNSALF